MRTLSGFIMAVIGAIIGVAGYGAYQSANNTISQGNSFWGLGWAFSSTSQSTANMYQLGGIAGMVIGGIILIMGLVVMSRGNNAATSPSGTFMKRNLDALAIAKERYAKGEISHEDFAIIKKHLG